MTTLLPRLDRHAAVELIEKHRANEIAVISAAMPDLPEVVTYAPVGGTRVENNPAGLADLRASLLGLAVEHGMPGPIERMTEFEGRAARLLHDQVPMTPHEASHDDVWNYLTCCWLLDIAVWRFGADADLKRFVGDINRNTFRRMWWRAEVLGTAIDLAAVREDEFVSIMERPTLASDRRLARAMAIELLERVQRGDAPERMRLMREASKRLMRLTPFVAFAALSNEDLAAVVNSSFESAAASISEREVVAVQATVPAVPDPSPEVADITALSAREPEEAEAEPGPLTDVGDPVAQVAVDLARRTGRVTNLTLRNVTHITPEEALDVLKGLVAAGELVRKGERRGTHYVLPVAVDQAEQQAVVVPDESSPHAAEQPQSVVPPSRPAPVSPRPIPAPPGRGPADSALRRLLRRGR